MMKECKGLKIKSLFKFCLTGVFVFSIIVAITGTIGGYFYTDSWSGPKGYAEIDISLMGDKYLKEEIDTSLSVKDLLIFLVITPVSSVLIAITLWLLFLIGQSIYSYFHTMNLTFTQRGLSLISSIKYCFIGFFWSWVPLTILFALIYSRNTENLSTIKINGEPMGVFAEIIILSIGSIIAGVIYGIAIYSGNSIYSIYKPIVLEEIPVKESQEPTIDIKNNW